MAANVKEAVMYIEQGHVKVGVDTVTDPAFLVTRAMEDNVTWVQGSKLKRVIQDYRDERDDFNDVN
eukprot:CAMPEP_0116882460 /NCGR_PEP_ID=MMETSP0463-20121206/14695_1 /TAXON_ID=181622 /ORGANISM="Strombidinopsis sp, Strain SopsisLIS2011" /LENGTH=65 /DNA_ID=CAMNT_0004535673 /DNA_START=301 /DNA_END=498 /DNA_ORIENTATION=-